MTHNDLKAISRDWTIGRKLKYLCSKVEEWGDALDLRAFPNGMIKAEIDEALEICRSVPVPPTSIKDGSS